jgi:AcrR family transcriptional regulator
MELTEQQRRIAVLDAAWEVFSEFGFARGQVGMISERCHVSTATIYKLYPGKEQLFVAAYGHALSRFDQLIGEMRMVADPMLALCLTARRYAFVLNLKATRQLVRQQIAQNSTSAGPGRAIGNAVRAKVEGLFVPTLERCAEAGLISSDVIWRAHALIAGFIGHQTLIFGLVIDDDKIAHFSGDDLADDAVTAALAIYGTEAGRTALAAVRAAGLADTIA